MSWQRTVVAFAIVALVAESFAVDAEAQGVRTRILDELVVERDLLHWEIVVRFSEPIRVLRHAPLERASVIHVDVEPVIVADLDATPRTRRETLTPPPALRSVLREVVYTSDAPGTPQLDVFFEREVAFELLPGDDFRSVVIRVARDRVHAYAVQIGTVAPGAEPPILPDLPALRGTTVYAARLVDAEGVRRRIRVGFYAEPAEAEAAARALRTWFPGAFVVGVSADEQRASQALALGGATPALPAPPRSAGEAGEPPQDDLGDRADDWMEEGRRALTAGELQKAALIFTRLVDSPDRRVASEAKELLGLTRERTGQLAHAKADYEEYLEQFPDAEGAGRVRQRLEALLTIGAPAREPLGDPGRLEDGPLPRPPSRFRTYGSAYTAYSRQSQITDFAGEQVNDSSVLSQLFLDSRLDRSALQLRSQFSGGYVYDLEDDGNDELRIDTLFLEAIEEEIGLAGSLGRRTQSTGGVLGRYDGVRIAKRLGERYEIAGVGGLPVYSQDRDEIDTERVFGGLSAATHRLFDTLDLEVFAIQQWVGSRTDRTAIGGELRYFDRGGRSLFGFVDYDVRYASLNVAQLNFNTSLGSLFQVHALADHRNVPFLTTSNALIGQLTGSLDDLEAELGGSEIDALARDRTAEATTFNVGGTFRARRNLQVAADVTASRFSGMPASGDVPAIESTGYEWSYLGQLIATELLREGDVGVLSLRVFDGHDQDVVSLTVDTRHPLTRRLRVEPLVTAEYRFLEDADMLRLRPQLRIDYQRWGFNLDLEGGYEWTRRNGLPDESGYFLLTGLRYDF